MGFKIPKLDDSHKPILNQIEKIRSARMQGAEAIEKKLFTITKNANAATTDKKKELSAPE